MRDVADKYADGMAQLREQQAILREICRRQVPRNGLFALISNSLRQVRWLGERLDESSGVTGTTGTIAGR